MRISGERSFGIDNTSTGLLVPSALFIASLLCLPLATLVWLSVSGSADGFLHVARNVVPTAGITTVVLMAGIGLFTAIVGTLSAWLVTHFEFPFRRILQWALMLPLAVPTYISAYSFVEFFSYTGPIQEAVRDIGGYQSSRDYWFPDIRSLWGTVMVLGLVLYPYVYLSVRTLFLLQGHHLKDSARMLGASGRRVFFQISLPLARPAIVLGVTLVLMETINDIGAVEYLGVNTLTLSVFSLWLNQSDLAGAAQIAVFLLAIVVGLLFLELKSRGARRYSERQKKTGGPIGLKRLGPVAATGALAATASPVLLGFGIPVATLVEFSANDLADLASPSLLEPLFTSLALGGLAALLAVSAGLLLSYLLRIHPTRTSRTVVRFASVGYAIPGTLIALGVFIPLAAFDNAIDGILRSSIGISTGLLITGSGAALVFAYVVRFMAMAEGTLENGFAKISPNIDMAARSLGRSRKKVLTDVLMPLLLPAISSAALLVFVDVVKELSATILLRPFGMNTLATHVYDFASQGRVEDGAVACLLIIAIGIVPVILITRGAAPQ